jgi:hypothetical protein
VYTVNRGLRAPASGAPVDRSLKAPMTRIRGGPSPVRSKAIEVLSCDITFSKPFLITSPFGSRTAVHMLRPPITGEGIGSFARCRRVDGAV